MKYCIIIIVLYYFSINKLLVRNQLAEVIYDNNLKYINIIKSKQSKKINNILKNKTLDNNKKIIKISTIIGRLFEKINPNIKLFDNKDIILNTSFDIINNNNHINNSLNNIIEKLFIN